MHLRRIVYVSIVLFGALCMSYSDKHHIKKRYVLFPRGGAFKIVIGIGIPLKLGKKQSIAIGWNFQMQYDVPTNSTTLHTWPPTVSRSREKRDTMQSDRGIFYAGLETILYSKGYNGRQCLLHTICENAVSSLDHADNGLYGKLLHIVFTPSYGDEELEPNVDLVYLEAEKAGNYGAECDTLYSECNMDNGFLDVFSMLENEIFK